MSNTGHKYISFTAKGWYTVTLPEASNLTAKTISRKDLEDAILERNRVLGYDPDVDEPGRPLMPTRHTMLDPEAGQSILFGATADQHLGSKYERLDALHAYYQELNDLGATKVFVAGNYLEGEASFNKHDIKVWGFENQVEYAIQNWPHIPGITTYLLDGDDHEGWWSQRDGIEVGSRFVQAARDVGRNDFRYLGYMEADVVLNVGGQDVKMRIVHGGGGSSKAVSLASQNLIDSWTTPEMPKIVILGHYHKSHHLPNYRGATVIQTGTMQEQTPFMRKKKLIAALGGWVVTVRVATNGRVRVGGEYLDYEPYAWKHQLRTAPIRLEDFNDQ